MPRLFKIPNNVRVRITSKLVRWLECGELVTIDENVTWEGLTTSDYETFLGERRRLIICHTIPRWSGTGTYQTDCDCVILD